MRKATAFGLALSLLGLQPAQASVIYNWISDTSNIGSLIFSDAAVSNGGQFHWQELCAYAAPAHCAVTGDQAAVTYRPGMGSPFSQPVVSIDLDVTFNSDLTLSGQVRYVDWDGSFTLAGDGAEWSGTMDSDFLNCKAPCQVTGYWLDPPEPANVPEPASIAIVLAMGAVGFARGWRR